MIKSAILLLFVSYSTQYDYENFIPRAFKINPHEGVYDIDVGLPDQNKCMVKAIGDFNGDK